MAARLFRIQLNTPSYRGAAIAPVIEGGFNPVLVLPPGGLPSSSTHAASARRHRDRSERLWCAADRRRRRRECGGLQSDHAFEHRGWERRAASQGTLRATSGRLRSVRGRTRRPDLDPWRGAQSASRYACAKLARAHRSSHRRSERTGSPAHAARERARTDLARWIRADGRRGE